MYRAVTRGQALCLGLEFHHLISSHFSLWARGEADRCVILQEKVKESFAKLVRGYGGGDNCEW